MIRSGIAGIGFMGMMHAYGLLGRHVSPGRAVTGARLGALASSDDRKRHGDWTMIQGNYGPRGGREDLGGIRAHPSVEALLADPEVDLVHVCLPTPLHRRVAEAALDAGKHVLVEKPIAFTLADADAILAAARRNHRHLLVAHVLPFRSEFAFALKAAGSRRFGAPLGARLTRLLARPDGPSGSGGQAADSGAMIDLHVHDTHFIRMLFGSPVRVLSRGRPDYVNTLYEFADPRLEVTSQSGMVSAAGRPFTHGFELYLERATIGFDLDGIPLTVWNADGTVERPELAPQTDVDAFVDEIQAAVSTIGRGGDPGPLAGSVAREALALCLAEAESVRTARPVSLG